jgi:hypothetical protein
MRRVGVTRLRKTRGESPRRLDPPGLVARFLRAGGRGRQPSIQCLRRPGGIETPAPFSPTRVFDPSCRHWPSPGVELAESEPGRRSTPHASPTASEPDCEQASTAFRHCSGPVRQQTASGRGPGVVAWSGDRSWLVFHHHAGARDPVHEGESRRAEMGVLCRCGSRCCRGRGLRFDSTVSSTRNESRESTTDT